MNNTATATFAPPPPARQTIHEAGPWPSASVIFSIAGCIALVVVSVWLVLVFLFDQAGYQQPEEAAAEFVFQLAAVSFILLVVVVVALKLFGPLFAGIHDLGQAHIEAKVRVAEMRYKAAQQLPVETAHRMTTKDKHQYQLVMHVMERTFSTIDEAGKIRGSGEPYSRRRAGTFIPYNETEPVGEHSTLATGLRQWLLDKGILLDNRTVNVAEFPDIQAVQRVLMDDPKYSIVSNIPVGGMSGHYIEHGNESWA